MDTLSSILSFCLRASLCRSLQTLHWTKLHLLEHREGAAWQHAFWRILNLHSGRFALHGGGPCTSFTTKSCRSAEITIWHSTQTSLAPNELRSKPNDDTFLLFLDVEYIMCDSKAGQHLPLPIQVHFGLLLVLPLELCCLTIPYYSHFSLPLSFSVPFLFELSFHFLLPFCIFPPMSSNVHPW